MSSNADSTEDDKASSPKCRLLSIPRELRDEISSWAVYEHCIFDANNETVVVIDSRAYDCGLYYFDLKPPVILTVCKQLRQEASQIYYGEVNFIFDEPITCVLWLKSLDTESRSMMKRLSYCDCCVDFALLSGTDKKTEKETIEQCQEIGKFLKKEGMDDVLKALRVCEGSRNAGPVHNWVRYEESCDTNTP